MSKQINVVAAFRAFVGPYSAIKITQSRGRQGVAWSCDLYRGATKIAEVRDDANGGMVWFRYENSVDQAAEVAALHKHMGTVMPASEMRFEPEGHFMAAMLDMREMLIKLRNKAKQGYLVVVTDKDIQDGCYGVPLAARLTPPELAHKVVDVRGGYSLNEQLLAD